MNKEIDNKFIFYTQRRQKYKKSVVKANSLVADTRNVIHARRKKYNSESKLSQKKHKH